MKYELDVGIKLDNEGFGNHSLWTFINDKLHELAGEDVSAGTGFGVRDMQFHFNTEEQARAAEARIAEYFKDKLEYSGLQLVDDEGYPLDEEGKRIV